MEGGRTKFGSAPIPPFIKGYYSTDFYSKTFPITATDKVIKGYKRLW